MKEEPMTAQKWLLLFMINANVQITNVMQFPVTGKLKSVGPSLNFLSRFSENLRKSLYKIENSGNL